MNVYICKQIAYHTADAAIKISKTLVVTAPSQLDLKVLQSLPVKTNSQKKGQLVFSCITLETSHQALSIM